MKITNLKTNFLRVIFIFIFLVLLNGRSLLGVYLFGFRLGEILTGFSIMLIMFIIYKYKFFENNFNKRLIFSYFGLILYFVIINLINMENFLNLYLYKSSVFIWYISFLFFGMYIFNKIEISKSYFIFGYVGLGLQFIFNVLYYPEFLTLFFNNFSDKTQFLKGSEIAIFFIVVTFFSNRLNKNGIFLDIFIVFSSFYIPLMFFKSRAGGIAIFIYFVIETIVHRKYFSINLKKTFLLTIFFISSFTLSSFYILDYSLEFKKAPAAVEQVVKHKYVISNTYDDEVSLIFFRDGRFYSADGNFNWRLQLWQDVLFYTVDEEKVILGSGFSKKLPMFETQWYAGEDGLNENTHNFFINVYAKSGILGLTILLIFYYLLLKINKKQFNSTDLIIFITPLFIISMFDGSMENPYFAIVFYFFLSSFFSGIKFKQEII